MWLVSPVSDFEKQHTVGHAWYEAPHHNIGLEKEHIKSDKYDKIVFITQEEIFILKRQGDLSWSRQYSKAPWGL